MKAVGRGTNEHETDSEDKSDTVITGFNTVETKDWVNKLIDEAESTKSRRRAKSLGHEVRVPFIQDSSRHSQKLDQIDEIDDSQDSDLDETVEKRIQSPLVRLPAAKRLKEKKDKNERDVK